MNIDGALSIATGGLANINRQMTVVSQNVANVSTPGYSVEVSTQQSVTAGGEGMGVRSGPAIRTIDLAMQAEVFSQNAAVSGLQTRQAALQSIDSVLGTPGYGGDLASQLGKLQDQFSNLLNNPANQAQQSQVVLAATDVARGINALSAAYTSQRQTAQDAIVAGVATLNATLGTIGGISSKIVALKAAGQSTADLENQRDAAVGSLSQLLDVNVRGQPNGNLLIITAGGLMLPTTGTADRLSTGSAVVEPNSFYPGGGIPSIRFGNADVTGQLRGGQIGANIALRDTILPTDQAELDELAQNLAGRFDAQGLTLFTDPDGNVLPPAGTPTPPVQNGYIGFAATIQVNAAVQNDPSLVRDGTHDVAATPNGPSAFLVNPLSGPAGFTTMINRVLNYALGAEAQSGVPQPASNTVGLGPAGNLNAPYVAPATLGQLAATMVSAQAQASGNTSKQLGTEQAVQTTLVKQLSAQSGVNMDTEMSNMIQLQNAYIANAKVIATVQAMWADLIATVR